MLGSNCIGVNGQAFFPYGYPYHQIDNILSWISPEIGKIVNNKKAIIFLDRLDIRTHDDPLIWRLALIINVLKVEAFVWSYIDPLKQEYCSIITSEDNDFFSFSFSGEQYTDFKTIVLPDWNKVFNIVTFHYSIFKNIQKTLFFPEVFLYPNSGMISLSRSLGFLVTQYIGYESNSPFVYYGGLRSFKS